ncbi:hypothetical protein B0A55_04313 [Friedmanniomyces simplex]|uniref:Uncharacterized protein n=1 Tax=Friedmanniomyces simplex TaxID=329884 RepID=A0A4U0XK48_9PEZI|nr:hypothetical protein B0A55_04313 [Friedmanniomyces simplex]
MLSNRLVLDRVDQVMPTKTDLDHAVQRNSMSAVFTILAIWQGSPDMLDDSESIDPAYTIGALLTAIANDRPDIVSLLLAVGRGNRMPVMEAIRAGSTRIFDAFLWNGWDINEPMGHDEPSALGYAVRNEKLVQWFLDHGADPNAGYRYDTPLSRAALVGSMDVIVMLLAKGGDLQRGDLLHWAVERDRDACDVVALLLAWGAPPDRLRFDGVEPQWSVYGKNGLGSPLHRAVVLNRLDVVSELLEHGADREIKDTMGRTAQPIAETLGNMAAVALLSVERVNGSF